MALPSIRRRISALESAMPPVVDYPPLAAAEVEAIARRVQAGDWLSAEEVDRLEQHCPIIHGELLVTARKRVVTIKRYITLDLAEL